MKTRILFFGCLVASLSFSQTTVTFYPSKDVSLGYHDNFNTANTNYEWAYQFAGYVIDGANGGYNKNRALIQFDLTSISTATIIDSAKLYFYHYEDYTVAPLDQGHAGNNSCYLKKVSASWDEMSVTWNSQPNTTDVDMVTVPQSTSPTQDYVIDLTVLTQYFISNPSMNNGLKFGLINEVLGNNLSFYSSNSIDSAKRPKLVVYYGGGQTNDIDENTISDSKVYPNPVDNVLTVKSKNIESVNVYDQTGKIVVRAFNETHEEALKLDVSKLSSGNYILEIFSIGGTKSQMKFVKK